MRADQDSLSGFTIVATAVDESPGQAKSFSRAGGNTKIAPGLAGRDHGV